jgi:MFS family permease
LTHFWSLLRRNRNYRYLWLGQVVSEVGDHFNTIAVLSLTLRLTGSGMMVGGVMLARTLPAILAGPLAGVALDRLDRRRLMLASNLVRAAVALGFVLILTHQQVWLLYALSALLMFTSPFFSSGRLAILPKIAPGPELHTANALTQTTSWLTLSVGTMLGGISAMRFGYASAFVVNTISFLFSAWAVSRLHGGFLPERSLITHHSATAFYHDFRASLRYMRATPLVLAIALVWVGWATGGGAAQILFTLFGEIVFQAGPAGIGWIWGSAGLGLVAGGVLAHRLGRQLTFDKYKTSVTYLLFVHGAAYVLYALMPTLAAAAALIALSRLAMGANNVLHRTMLLTHVPDEFRGRVFSTIEALMQVTMMLSMTAASVATTYFTVRQIGVAAGCLSTSTAFFWVWTTLVRRLPEPPAEPPPQAEEEYESPVRPA